EDVLPEAGEGDPEGGERRAALVAVSRGRVVVEAHPRPVYSKLAAVAIEIGVYLPQVGLAWDELRSRVVACDRLGIDSVWFMDHLYPPGLPGVPSFEAWTTASARAGVPGRGALRRLGPAAGLPHPALLAQMASTLDHASGGRLNLGLGSGSYAPEFAQFGLPFPGAAERAAPLGEALDVLRLLFTEEVASYRGRFHLLDGA